MTSTTLASSDKALVAKFLRRLRRRFAGLYIDRCSQQVSDTRQKLVECRISGKFEPTRPCERNNKFLDDAAGPFRHHQHTIGQEPRFHDAVRDEEHRLAVAHPYLLQLEAH